MKAELINNKKIQFDETFAYPTNKGIPLLLLCIFAGKPSRSALKLLEEDNKTIDLIRDHIIVRDMDYTSGTEIKTAIISNNRTVKAKAKIEDLLWEAYDEQEQLLTNHIKNTFGAEGIRHFLAYMIAIEENGRTGYFEWNLNKHLERLGYKKNKRGQYKKELRYKASYMIKLFESLILSLEKKKGNKLTFNNIKLFTWWTHNQELKDYKCLKKDILKKELINESYQMQAGLWYINAFIEKDNSSLQYTKLLKKIVRENHISHYLTLLLAPLFAIFWRINPEGRKFKVGSLIEWTNLNLDNKQKLRDIRKLEEELNYMNENGYLGEWSHNGNKDKFSKSDNPIDITIHVKPPCWMKNEFRLITQKKEKAIIKIDYDNNMNLNEFNAYLNNFIKNSGNQKLFAKKLGISPTLITKRKKRQRNISSKLTKKIRQTFGNLPRNTPNLLNLN